MSMLLLSRRAAEDFAEALDAGVATELTVTSLLALSDELGRLPVDPDPRFRSNLRHRLLALAADPPPQVLRESLADRFNDALTGWRAQRRMALAVAMMVALLMVGVTGVLGSRSLPGDAFYGVKRAAEDVQLFVAHGKLARGQRHLQFAAVRLREVSGLVDRNSALVAAGSGRVVAGSLSLSPNATELVVRTLQDMDEETVAGTRDLTEYWRESGQARPLHTLDSFAAGQRSQLAAVLPALPVSARAPGMDALALINSVGHRAQALIDQGPCDAACQKIAGGPTMSGGFDVLGPLPCPEICPGSGAAQSPAAIVIPGVDPTPGASGSAGPAASSPPAVLDSPAELPATETPRGVPTEPSPLEPSPSDSPSPWFTAPPTPVESTTASAPVETSPPPTSTPSVEPSPTDTATPSASESPSPPDPTATGSPTPERHVVPWIPSATPPPPA